MEYCIECQEELLGDPNEMLGHYVREHFESRTLRLAIQHIAVEGVCIECGEEAELGLELGRNALFRYLGCGECIEEDPVRKLFKVRIPSYSVESLDLVLLKGEGEGNTLPSHNLTQ